MRLKHLELQGYKSFAARTEFLFDGGITAIVGPNGSGKSNIADAVRWVLGEQSYRSLRGKRTEDMIFTGSTQRARVGMASCSLTLDNSSGWLPIEFSEVAITRRAYRSGENEYLLNGSRVRLRDINELLAASGLGQRTYTVIGQGLVDAVLSLRAEDRRSLFEEAAGISLYRSKRTDALARLEETQSNLIRVRDIISEIAPRLGRLEREAERASRYDLLSQQLEGHLRVWYGYRWRQQQLAVRRAKDALARRELAMMQVRASLDDLETRTAGLHVRQASLREHLRAWQRESNDLRRQREEVQRELAVLRERDRQLVRQGDQIKAELLELEKRIAGMLERLAIVRAEADARRAAFLASETLVVQAQAELEAHELRRADMSAQLVSLQACVLDLTSRMSDRQSRLRQLGERRASMVKEQAEHQSTIDSLQSVLHELDLQVEVVEARRERLRADSAIQSKELDGLSMALAATQERQSGLGDRLAEARGHVERLQARHELLARLRSEGDGLHEGVRAVLAACGGRSNFRQQVASTEGDEVKPGAELLEGIVGTVAQALRSEPVYELAIEVALGERLQDVIVESWVAAEAALTYLRAGNRGYATFLPLDTVRSKPALKLPVDRDVVGLAADLVHAQPGLTKVAEALLGRTIVVRDLEAAKRVFRLLEGEFKIVTMAGDLVRSDGSLAGGGQAVPAHGHMLAREREWRELPSQLAAAEAERNGLDSELVALRAASQRTQAKAFDLEGRRRETEERLSVVESQRHELDRDLERIKQQIAWLRDLEEQLGRNMKDLDDAEGNLHADLTDLTAKEEVVQSQVLEIETALARLAGVALFGQLSELRTEVAVAQGAWEHAKVLLSGLHDEHAQLQKQLEAKRQQLDKLEEERSALAAQVTSLGSRDAIVCGWLDSLARNIESVEAEETDLESERAQLRREETTLRARLRHAESSHSQAKLAAGRQGDRLQNLRRQIVDDFGLVEMESAEGMPEQPPLPLGEMVALLPDVEAVPQGLEDDIHELKAQLRRMGSVNPNAPEEYSDLLERHTFLCAQVADLEEAIGSLKEVVAELDEMMHREFQATFDAAAAHFESNFTRLFDGGSAQLVLTEPDDLGNTGVEIVAQPPGKRQQTLALLSGGERALTAAALIFAVLEVSPPPFCILDEVDAMLDEANVKRFRQSLEHLAQRTQIIIITHNRGTIEAANTIYGVSMGDDSVSQVLSLRLEGERIAAPDGSAVELKQG